MKIIRFLIAPIVGILLILVSVTGIQAVGHQIYPPPSAMAELYEQRAAAMLKGDQTKAAEIQAQLDAVLADYVATAPLGALLVVVAAWLAGSFVSAFVAAMITPILRIPMGLMMGLMVVSGILITAQQIPHPVWMTIVGVTGSLGAAAIAGMIVARFTRAGTETAD